MAGLFAKKSLGQNFLTSKTVGNSIVDAAEIVPGETVLEIGPGKGMLTGLLLARGARVVAVEKDDRMIPHLTTLFAKEITARQFTLIHGDILEQDLFALGLAEHHYKLVANIPYYITGEIMRTFLSEKSQPSLMVMMVQREVCDRIVARDGKESILSISVKAYGTPHYIEKVPARLFSPAPNVDSAVIAIKHINRDFFTSVSEREFFNTVKKAFAHKRKVLIQNLEVPAADREAFCAAVAMNPKARSEELTAAQWREATKFLHRAK